jgi:hypothetical protein
VLEFYVYKGDIERLPMRHLGKIEDMNSNDEGNERATLQCDEMLECLKATYAHASRNFLKRCQSVIDGIPIPNPRMPTPTFITPKLEVSTLDYFRSLNFKPFTSDDEWMLSNTHMLHNQSKSMAMMASHFVSTFEI